MKSIATTRPPHPHPFYPILSPMERCGTLRWLPLLALLHCLSGLATTVYKSVDENGVVSFSDSPPEENTLVEEVNIDIPESGAGDQARQRLEDMRETTDRMVADRMAREKHRAELRELDARTGAMQTPPYESEDDYYPAVYTGGYGYYDYPYPYRRHHRRPDPIQPGYPIARPPLRPVKPPSYQDDFPAPHIRPLFTPRTRGAPRE
jgi:Domain of unknown function (DUF4124)